MAQSLRASVSPQSISLRPQLTRILVSTPCSYEPEDRAGSSPELCSFLGLKDACVSRWSSSRLLLTAAADLIQDLYLKELRAYKPVTQKASDAEGHVQKFNPPAPPKSPEETNLASEMKEYEEQVVEIEGQSASGETQVEEDFFEDIEEDDDEPAHH